MNTEGAPLEPNNSENEADACAAEVLPSEAQLLSSRRRIARSKDSYSISSWIFQRLLSISYLAAFGSMSSQIIPLVGHNGIQPIYKLIDYLHSGQGNLMTLGSLAWFNSSDSFLQALCFAGVIASGLAFATVLPPVCLGLCWLLWLSIVNVGQEFLSFQWDILLLESGFLAIFLAPWRPLDLPFRRGQSVNWMAPHMVAVWLFRWLLFRLMLESGLCKIISGDETWRSLTAMNYHYHTQPLPTPVAWFADKLPDIFLKVSTLMTFVIELLAPFLILLRKTRLAGALSLMLLQAVIALTGNYAFFNLLSFGLCFFLINDESWLKLFAFVQNGMQRHKQVVPTPIAVVDPRIYEKVAAIACGSLVAFLSAVQIFSSTIGLPAPLAFLTNSAERLYLFNTYGLFATMTTVRDEIIVEGSMDGNAWQQYEFKYKPGNVFMPPCIVAPGQPRLDWQMWFASLGDVSQSPWFAHFIVRLFQNSPEVLSLLKTNPFPNQPPAYLRARLYTYTFSDWRELLHGGQWWRSEYKGEFLPVISARALERSNSQ